MATTVLEEDGEVEPDVELPSPTPCWVPLLADCPTPFVVLLLLAE